MIVRADGSIIVLGLDENLYTVKYAPDDWFPANKYSNGWDISEIRTEWWERVYPPYEFDQD